jgi:hypothetical protein
MAVAVKTSGTQTATVTTEHTLATVTDAGVYELTVDVSALLDAATPDEVELRVYAKVLSGGTEREVSCDTLRGTQGKPIYKSLAFISPHHFKATLKQTQGTSRDFDWAIYNT